MRWADRPNHSEEFFPPANDSPSNGAFDVTDGLDRIEIEELAWYLNPRVREARAETGITAASEANAGWWQDPSLNVNLERILESVPEPWILGGSVGLEIPVSGRLAREKSRARAEHRAAVLRVERIAWEERFALRSEWIQWQSLLAKIGATTTFLDRLEEIAAQAVQLASDGAIRRADARFFTMDVVRRKAELRGLETQAETLLVSMRTRTGLSPAARIRFVPSTHDPRVDIPADARADVLRKHSPVLAELMAERAAHIEVWREECAKRYPDLGINPGYGVEDGMDRALLGISLPLPLWNRNRKAVAQSEAAIAAADVRLIVAFEEQIQALASTELELQGATARRELIEHELLPQVVEQVTELRALGQLGELSTLALLESLDRELSARLEWVDARQAEARALNLIEERLGPPTSPSVQTTEGSP